MELATSWGAPALGGSSHANDGPEVPRPELGKESCISKGKAAALPEHKICITIEGSDAEGGRVRAADLAKTVHQVIRMLSRIDGRTAEGKRKSSFYLRVTDLSYASPVRVVMEQVLIDPKTDRRERVMREFLSVMAAVESDEEIPPMDYVLLDAASDLSSPVGKTLKKLSVSANGAEQSVDQQFRECLAQKLKPEETSYGSVRGMLEYINIHGKTPVFRIYPDVGGDQLACRFASTMLTDARDGIGKFVEVRGIVHYKVVAQYPHAIDVRELEVLPGGGAPDWIAARGLLPALTGDLTTEEYIAKVRTGDG